MPFRDLRDFLEKLKELGQLEWLRGIRLGMGAF
jgi:hypothetical protein